MPQITGGKSGLRWRTRIDSGMSITNKRHRHVDQEVMAQRLFERDPGTLICSFQHPGQREGAPRIALLEPRVRMTPVQGAAPRPPVLVADDGDRFQPESTPEPAQLTGSVLGLPAPRPRAFSHLAVLESRVAGALLRDVDD